MMPSVCPMYRCLPCPADRPFMAYDTTAVVELATASVPNPSVHRKSVQKDFNLCRSVRSSNPFPRVGHGPNGIQIGGALKW